jgi:hypothetical protein
MAVPAALTAEQVRKLLASEAPLSALDQVQILRYLALAQITLEGQSRQLRSAIGRIGK